MTKTLNCLAKTIFVIIIINLCWQDSFEVCICSLFMLKFRDELPLSQDGSHFSYYYWRMSETLSRKWKCVILESTVVLSM